MDIMTPLCGELFGIALLVIIVSFIVVDLIARYRERRCKAKAKAASKEDAS